MSKISFNCPSCDSTLECHRALIGKTAKCDECGNVVRVPRRKAEVLVLFVITFFIGVAAGVIFSPGSRGAHQAEGYERAEKAPAAADSQNISGEWELHMGRGVDALTIQDNDGVLSGTYSRGTGIYAWAESVGGIRIGTNVSFSFTHVDQGNYVQFDVTAQTTGAKMEGHASISGIPLAPKTDAPWVAFKKK